MRILRLDLLAFGPFTNEPLEFASGGAGLHVVYGRNEAGKSSALRALRQFLFGIEKNSRDNFVHAHRDLRVAATLRDASGRELRFVRRKGNKGTLLAADGKTEADSRDLAALLGSIEEQAFNERFGIDYAQLVAGGKAIADGENVGQVLFSAALGVSGLARLQAGLEQEASEIFKGSGSKWPLNVALREYADLREAVKQDAVPSQVWQDLSEKVRRTESEAQSLRAKARQLAAQKSLYQRVLEAQPLVHEREQLGDELAGLENVPRLAQDFSQRRQAAERAVAVAAARLQEVERNLADLQQEIPATEPPRELLRRAAEVVTLRERKGAVEKAQGDLQGLLGALRQAERELGLCLNDLGREATLTDAQERHLEGSARAAIRSLGQEYHAHRERLERSRQDLERLAADVAENSQRLAQFAETPSVEELRLAVARQRRSPNLERELADCRRKAAAALEECNRAASRLGLPPEALPRLETVPVPSAETIDRFDRAFAECQQAAERHRQQAREFRNYSQSVAAELQSLQAELDVPTEEDLTAARNRRNELWGNLAAILLGRESAPPRESAGASLQELTGEYERRLKTTDDLSDRLRREADRVAKKAQLAVNLEQSNRQGAECESELTRLDSEREALLATWRAEWRPVAVEPRTPAEMRSWLGGFETLRSKMESVRELSALQGELANQIAKDREELIEQLRLIQAPHSKPNATREELLDWGDAVVRQVETRQRDRGDLERDLAKARKEHAAATRAAAEAEQKLARWREQWSEAVARLRLEASATPDEANAVLEIVQKILEKRRDQETLEDRISGIQSDCTRFEEDVREFLAICASDLLEHPPLHALEWLFTRLAEAQAEAVRCETRAKRERELQAALGEARQQHEVARQQLAALCREARCASSDDLPELEARHRQRELCLEKLERANRQLAHLAQGAALAEFLAQVREHTSPELPRRIEELDDELLQLEQSQSALNQEIGAAKDQLARIDGGAAAAEAEAEAALRLAQIQSLAARYARLKLAAQILDRTVERYRQRHQDPVLARASELFAALTLGSFQGLRVEEIETEKLALVGVRPGGKQTVSREGMSEGTCDQMYLALRLASLEEFLKNHAPVPFIVDDILIKFDDDRAVAALKALASLSRQTQVIFFTHHSHLVELAQEHLAGAPLFVHALGEWPAGRNISP